MLTQVSEVVPVPAWPFSLLVLSCGGCWSVTAKMLRNLLALRQIGQRTISTTSRRHLQNKVPEKQKLFQEDDGIPLYLKGGIADVLLYRATMVLGVGGKAFGMFEGL